MPQLLLFDLGNVLLYFSHRRGAEQLAALAGVDAEAVWQFVYAADLNLRCDEGLVTAQEFCETFRKRFPCDADDAAICHAASDIFDANPGMLGLLARLEFAGHRLGLLSNTCDMHIDWLKQRSTPLIPSVFDTVVLSYQEKLSKPDLAIYKLAADRAGVAPREVFYVDDREENVIGARDAGFDTVQYTTTVEYVMALRSRGVWVNY